MLTIALVCAHAHTKEIRGRIDVCLRYGRLYTKILILIPLSEFNLLS